MCDDKKQSKGLRRGGAGSPARHRNAQEPPTIPGPETGWGGAVLSPLNEIMAHQTPRGGWTKKILAVWGVPWPPPKGWKAWLVENGMPYQRRTTNQ